MRMVVKHIVQKTDSGKRPKKIPPHLRRVAMLMGFKDFPATQGVVIRTFQSSGMNSIFKINNFTTNPQACFDFFLI
jgi:hypothetical protein